MSEHWGYHLVLDCAGCDKPLIMDEKNIRDFLEDLLKVTDMKAWGEPVVANLQDCEEHIKGYSAVQLIHTSSITCHFADSTGGAYIDVFSCKTFDPSMVIDCVQRFFNPESVADTYLMRG